MKFDKKSIFPAILFIASLIIPYAVSHRYYYSSHVGLECIGTIVLAVSFFLSDAKWGKIVRTIGLLLLAFFNSYTALFYEAYGDGLINTVASILCFATYLLAIAIGFCQNIKLAISGMCICVLGACACILPALYRPVTFIEYSCIFNLIALTILWVQQIKRVKQEGNTIGPKTKSTAMQQQELGLTVVGNEPTANGGKEIPACSGTGEKTETHLCPECKNEVEARFKICPNCGYHLLQEAPIDKTRIYIGIIVSAVLILAAVLLITSGRFQHFVHNISYYMEQYKEAKAHSSGFLKYQYAALAEEWMELYRKALLYIILSGVGSAALAIGGVCGLFRNLKKLKNAGEGKEK